MSERRTDAARRLEALQERIGPPDEAELAEALGETEATGAVIESVTHFWEFTTLSTSLSGGTSPRPESALMQTA